MGEEVLRLKRRVGGGVGKEKVGGVSWDGWAYFTGSLFLNLIRWQFTV